MAVTNQYSPINNQFDSFNADTKSIRKYAESDMFVKQQFPALIFPSMTRDPLRENLGTAKGLGLADLCNRGILVYIVLGLCKFKLADFMILTSSSQRGYT